MTDFFEQLYQDTEDGFMYLWTLPDRETHWYPIANIKKAADMALRLSGEGNDVYYGVGLTGSKKTSKQRAESQDVVAIPGVWMDLDTKDDKHPDNPENINEIVELLNNFPISPSVLVRSGRGLHAYWLTKEMIACDTPSSRQQARNLLIGFQETIRQFGQQRGWKFDLTADLARILRVPGTMHYKGAPLPVEIIEQSGARYNFDDLEQYTMDVPESSLIEGRNSRFVRLPTDRPASCIMDNCAFVAQLKNPARLTEPEWFSALTVLTRGVDGFELIHELARPFLGDKYSFAKTEKKAQHAYLDCHPHTCQHIRKAHGFTGCPDDGCGVKSPVGWATAKKKGSKKKEKPSVDDFFATNEAVKVDNFTDLGNAERFARMFNDELKYCSHFGKWLIWDGVRWKIDETGRIMSFATQCIRSMYRDAAEVNDHDARKALTDHARKSESLQRLTSMVTLSQHMFAIKIDDLDRDEWVLNVNNGVINLKTGELTPHDPKNLITKLAPVTYDPHAECPVFEKFIASTFCDNQNIIQFMQRLLGYCLTGDTREQQFSIAFGAGRNGKGTLLNLVLDMLGDYGQATEASVLMAKKGEGGMSNDIARMRGARYVLASEVAAGKRFNESLVKQMTGQDKLAARFLYQETFEFMPQFKLILLANDKPSARGDDQALWDRIQLIPFTQRFVGDKQDNTLKYRLREQKEMSGVLNWLIKGCLEWQRMGLKPPEEVMQATNEYRFENDQIQNWMDDCCVVSPYAVASTSDLYKNFQEWALKNGEKFILNVKNFGKQLSQKGFMPFKGTGGSRKMKGIGILDERHDQMALTPIDSRDGGTLNVQQEEPF